MTTGYKILTINKETREEDLSNGAIPNHAAALEFARHMDEVEPECEHHVVDEDYVIR